MVLEFRNNVELSILLGPSLNPPLTKTVVHKQPPRQSPVLTSVNISEKVVIQDLLQVFGIELSKGGTFQKVELSKGIWNIRLKFLGSHSLNISTHNQRMKLAVDLDWCKSPAFRQLGRVRCWCWRASLWSDIFVSFLCISQYLYNHNQLL